MPSVELPWGAWYGDGQHRLELPSHWSVDVLRPRNAPPCPPLAVEHALDAPVDTPPLQAMVSGCRSACIVVDDLARPTPAALILPAVLEQLHQVGLNDAEITIVVATGSHGQLSPEQIALKVGPEVAARYRVSCHDCRGDLAPTGIRYGDRELHVNREFHRAELKIAVGSVLPHPFAGHSGGAKLVVPGLVDLSAVGRSHKFVQLGLRGVADPDRNRFRTEAEELARQLGLAFIVCVITNDRREPIGIVAGDPVGAHRHACELASSAYRTEVKGHYDCVIVNAYPKDVDLVQSESALLPLKSNLRDFVDDRGIVVLTTAASAGVGRHGLFEPGGANYQAPRKKSALGDRELWIYAPRLTTAEVHRLYWDGYPVYQNGAELYTALAKRFPGPASAAVLPAAPMQQIHHIGRVEPQPVCSGASQ